MKRTFVILLVTGAVFTALSFLFAGIDQTVVQNIRWTMFAFGLVLTVVRRGGAYNYAAPRAESKTDTGRRGLSQKTFAHERARNYIIPYSLRNTDEFALCGIPSDRACFRNRQNKRRRVQNGTFPSRGFLYSGRTDFRAALACGA